MSDNPALRSILLLAANPRETSPLRLQEEEREIKERLRMAGYGKVPINAVGSARSRDIQQAMLDFDPQIVHFTGHGAGEEGLIFEDVAGNPMLISSESMASLCQLFGERLECVVLNACHTEVQAEAIAEHIDYVIGMNQEIGDRAAIEFAVGFYAAVGAGKSFEFAYKMGCNAIQLAGIPEHQTPVLLGKKVAKKNEPIISDILPEVPKLSTYDPKTFTGREELISELLGKLQGQTRLVWVTGMSGIGKTTLGECVASRAWENEQSFQWVYLEILEGQSQDFGAVAAELLGKMGDVDLDPQLRNNPEQIAQRLIQRLKSTPCWIQMDSLERLLNPEQPTEFVDAYWAVFLQRCLTESDLGSRLVLTSQVFPIALTEFVDRYPKNWAEYRLDGLLEAGQQLEFFAKRGVASDHGDILARIAKTYEGHPLVLKLMAEEILQEFDGDVVGFWREYQREFEGVARELQSTGLAETEYNEALDRKVRERLKKSLARLPKDALDLLCRSAVFRRPVPKKFWLGMMGDRTLPQQKAAYGVLGDHALIEKEGRAIRQHNLIRDLAYNLLKADPDAWESAERQAAHLWLTVYQPAEDDANLEKIRGYLEAFDHYCEIEDWEHASKLYTIQIEPNQISLHRQLLTWAYYKELRQISQMLVDNVVDQTKVICLNQIGNAYRNSGDAQSSIDYHLQALKLTDEIKYLRGKASTLVNLGLTHTNLGNYEQAIIFLEQSLITKQEAFVNEPQERRIEECFTFGHLGNAYYGLGNYEEAINFHNQHLTMTRDISVRESSPQQSRISEGRALCRLGNAYKKLGQYQQAVSFYQESLLINCEMKDRRGKGITLVNMGEAQIKLEQYSESLINNQAALEIFREIGDRSSMAEALKNLAELYQALGEVEVARQYGQQALALATELGIPLAAECEALLLKIDGDGAI